MILLGLFIFSVIATLVAFLLNVTWYWLFLVFIGAFIVGVIILVCTLYIITLFYDMSKIIIKPKKFFGAMIYHVCVLLKSVLRIKVISEGFEQLKDLEGYAMVCNHQAIIDPICFILASKEQDISFIMKKEVRKIPLVGRWFVIAGLYYLDRENPREGLKTILNGVKALKAGRPVGIYVEGTRSKSAELGEFHEGSFKMPQKAQSPIVLCAIDNSYRMAKNYPWKKTKVYIKVCEVIPYEKYAFMSTKELAEYSHNVISNELIALREKYK